MSNSTESRDALASPNRSPIRLIFIGHGLTTEIDNCDADLQAYRWSITPSHGGNVYASKRHPPFSGMLSRVIAARMGFDLDGMTVDHINGDTLDNRRANLRVVSQRENNRNRRVPKNNTSGLMGVRMVSNNKKNPWRATLDGRTLGYFKTREEAHAVRVEEERKIWGVQPQREAVHQ